MKRTFITFLSFCLAITFVFSAVPSSTNAQVSVENDGNQNIFTDSFINKVEGFIEISNKEFKITDPLALRKKVTSDEFIALKEQIKLMNYQIQEVGKSNLEVEGQALVLQFDLEEVDGELITTYAAKEGINKVEFKVWGYKVWLSKTTVKKVLIVGSGTGGAAIGGAIGLVPGAVIGSLVGGILSEFISPAAARAIYAEVVYPVIVMKLRYQ